MSCPWKRAGRAEPWQSRRSARRRPRLEVQHLAFASDRAAVRQLSADPAVRSAGARIAGGYDRACDHIGVTPSQTHLLEARLAEPRCACPARCDRKALAAHPAPPARGLDRVGRDLRRLPLKPGCLTPGRWACERQRYSGNCHESEHGQRLSVSNQHAGATVSRRVDKNSAHPAAAKLNAARLDKPSRLAIQNAQL
jgi:hypothetical protein